MNAVPTFNLNHPPQNGVINFGVEMLSETQGGPLFQKQVDLLYQPQLTIKEAMNVTGEIQSRLQRLFQEMSQVRHFDGFHIQIHDARDETSEVFYRGTTEDFQGVFSLTCSLLKPVPNSNNHIHVGTYPIPVQWLYENSDLEIKELYPIVAQAMEQRYPDIKMHGDLQEEILHKGSTPVELDKLKAFYGHSCSDIGGLHILGQVYNRIQYIVSQIELLQNRKAFCVEIWNPFQLVFNAETQNYFNPREHLFTIPLIIQSHDAQGNNVSYSINLPTSWLYDDFQRHLERFSHLKESHQAVKKPTPKTGPLLPYEKEVLIKDPIVGFELYRQVQDHIEVRLSEILSQLEKEGMVDDGMWTTTSYTYDLLLNTHHHNLDSQKTNLELTNQNNQEKIQIPMNWIFEEPTQIKKTFKKLNKIGFFNVR